MIPLGPPYGNHKQRLATKTISLTRSGISTQHVLDYLSLDIMNETTDTFIGENADANSLRIF